MRTFEWFFDTLGELDWLAVIVGAIVLMVIGYLWYGPLFGKQWSAATGQAMESGMPATDKLIKHFVVVFVLSGAIQYFGVVDDFEHALVSALLLGVLLVAAAEFGDVIWSGKSTTVWFIDLLTCSWDSRSWGTSRA